MAQTARFRGSACALSGKICVTSKSGDALISANLSLTQGYSLTAIATHNTNHDSSEFPACFEITGTLIFADGFESRDLSEWSVSIGN